MSDIRFQIAIGAYVFLGAWGFAFGAICAAISIAFVRGEFASVGRNAERQDHEDGLGPKDEHAVGEAETPARSRQSNKPGREM